MERIPLNISGGISCPTCGNYRALGFLYVCRQERDIAYSEIRKAHSPDDPRPTKPDLRTEMEHVGLSESVIVTAEKGLYTDRQLDLLKTKKTELTRAIAASLHAAQMRDATVHVSGGGTTETFEVRLPSSITP